MKKGDVVFLHLEDEDKPETWAGFWRETKAPENSIVCVIEACARCKGPLSIMISREVPHLALICNTCHVARALFLLVRGDEQ